jgi:hypothetical protein
MPPKKNYCNQTNLSCYQNAQHWYYIRALKKYKSAKTNAEKRYYLSIVNYYTNNKMKL